MTIRPKRGDFPLPPGREDLPDPEGPEGSPIFAPIIVHGVETDEPRFNYFLLEWGPEDATGADIVQQAIPGKKLAGKVTWRSQPVMLETTQLGEWYKFRISVINELGWKSSVAPVSGGWIYQRAGFDRDDLERLDEVLNILPNSDFEFDLLEDGSRDLPYWEYWDGDSWETPVDGTAEIERGLFGRLTQHNLVLKAGGKVRSDAINIFEDRPYALSGYFIQDATGQADLTFRIAYYNVSDELIDHDYILMREDGLRSFNSSTHAGGSGFEQRDRVGTVMFPPSNVSYGRVEIINDGTADIWADDMMISQTDRVVNYISWDRESIESWEDTWQYRRNIAPNGTIDFTGLTTIEAFSNDNASVDIKIRWNWTPSNRKASGFIILGNLADKDTFSDEPTLSDHDFAVKIANASARKFDLVGVNPLNRYSFAIIPYATVQGGIAFADSVTDDSGPNDPGSPTDDDWIDFQAATVLDMMSAPRTQVNVTSESDTQVTLEFIVTSSNGEVTTTYYRLAATGSFTAVPLVGGTPTLTVNKTGKDVTVYYYSQGDETGRAESVLEFVIDRNRIPEILHVNSEYFPSNKTGEVSWQGDDDVERVDWTTGGPTFIVSGTSGSTGELALAAGETKTVSMTPKGRGLVGPQISATMHRPPETPRIELSVTSRTREDITVEYEVEGFGDTSVKAYSRTGSDPFAEVTEVSGTPTETINRDEKNIVLQYFASGVQTGFTSTIESFTIDVDRVPEISDTSVDIFPNNNTYIVRWWLDDDGDRLEYTINSGTTINVAGQVGSTSVQGINPGEKDVVDLVPYGPTGSGVATKVFPHLPNEASLPPYVVVSGASEGSDGGGPYLLIDVFSFDSEGNSAGSIEYAEDSSTWTDAGTASFQHKVYRPVTGDKLTRYRSYIGNLYSDTIVFNIDRDDIPEIRPSIGLTADQTKVKIEWNGDDDVASVEIVPSGATARTHDLQSGVDTQDTIDYGEQLNYTIQPFDGTGATGKAGEKHPLTITRPFADAPWISIAKVSEDNTVSPATITLRFDAESTAEALYYSSDTDIAPGDAGWTSVANGGTNTFNRPAGDISKVIRAYAELGTVYSPVATFTIDPDEVPSVTSAWYDPDFDNDQATLNWNVDDDTDQVQLYLDGSADGSPIATTTTTKLISGVTPGAILTYTIVPMRGGTEFPANARTVVIANTQGTVIPIIKETADEDGTTGTLTIVPTDPQSRITKVEFRTQEGNGSWSAWAEDASAPYSTTVSLQESHVSKIAYRVTYTIEGGTDTIENVVTYDTDSVPNIIGPLTGETEIEVSGNLNIDSYRVSWTGDSDTVEVEFDEDPNFGSPGTVSGRNGSFLFNKTSAATEYFRPSDGSGTYGDSREILIPGRERPNVTNVSVTAHASDPDNDLVVTFSIPRPDYVAGVRIKGDYLDSGDSNFTEEYEVTASEMSITLSGRATPLSPGQRIEFDVKGANGWTGTDITGFFGDTITYIYTYQEGGQTETKGGTAQTTYTKGDILFSSAADLIDKLAVGSEDDVLTVSSGVPTWAAAVAGGDPNQNAFSNILVNGTTVAADTTSDTVEFIDSTGISLSANATNDTVTFAVSSSVMLEGDSASGDLSGTYPSPTVAAISGTGVDSAAPAENDFMIMGALQWTHVPFSDTLHGDRGRGSLHLTATTSVAGFMSSSDKTKLNGIASGAEVNQNAFSNILVNGTTVAADSKTDTVEFIDGSGISLSANATNDTVTIALSATVVEEGDTAGGDLGGTYPNPTVEKIQSFAVDDASDPVTDDVLQFTGLQWEHVQLSFVEDDVNETITGSWTFDPGTGAPFAVGTGLTTKITDLNADMVDGFHASQFLQWDGAGYWDASRSGADKEIRNVTTGSDSSNAVSKAYVDNLIQDGTFYGDTAPATPSDGDFWMVGDTIKWHDGGTTYSLSGIA